MNRLLTLVFALLLTVSVFATPGVSTSLTAAGPTQVSISPDTAEATPGETVSFDIVVEQADNGVGAWEATLNLSDGSVAAIRDISLHGNPGLSTTDIAADNNSVYFDAALANTTDSGPVPIATVTVELTANGQTQLSPSVDALGDEAGNSYSVTDIHTATLSTASTPATHTQTTTTTTTSSQTSVAPPSTSATQSPSSSTTTIDQPPTDTETTQRSSNQSTATTTTSPAPSTSQSTAPTTTSTTPSSVPGFTTTLALFTLGAVLVAIAKRE